MGIPGARDPEPADLVGLFAAGAARRGDRPALVACGRNGAEEAWSSARLFGAAHRVALDLARRGVGRGDRVALLAASSPELVVAQLGALAAGAALVPINVAYRPREVAHLVADAEPKLAFAGAAGRATLDELAPEERRSVEAVLAVDGVENTRNEASVSGLAPALPSLSAGDLAFLLYTSGTTGPSKGAMLTHGNVGATIAALRAAWGWSERDTLLLTLPLFHLHGLVVGLFTALAAGATVRLEPSFDAARTLDRLASGEANLFFGVPTLYVRLVEELRARRARGARVDLSAVRLFASGSAPLAAETHAAFRALTGHAILERYGMSETGMLVSNPLDGERRAGTVGRPLPGVELRIADAEGRELPPGAEGEVEVRGENVFAGYWRAPEKTEASFREDAAGLRWFRTGDRGRIDPADGYLTLLGRTSELILSGGYNVYPREVEEVLLACEGVREAAVVGEPHPEFGQSPVAFLVVERELAPGELDAHCRAQLAAFKLPRRYVFVERLPRTALGKVEKRKLLDGGSA